MSVYSIRLQNLELERYRRAQLAARSSPAADTPTFETAAVHANRMQIEGEFPHTANAMTEVLRALAFPRRT